MAVKGNKIFISYRREDAADVAGRIRDWLVQTKRVTRDDIFMDVATILPGADFLQVIEKAIGQCKAMIIIISPSWLKQVNSPDTSYVRLEAEAALRHNVPVIPVLVGGAQAPAAEQLPPTLRSLTRRNARPVRPDSFDYDMDWVRRALGIGASLRARGVAAISVVLLVALSASILSQIPGNPVSRELASLLGASPTPSAKPTTPAPPAPKVIVRMNSQQVPGSAGEADVSASCASGEQLLSGGYWVNTAQGELPIMAEASYPADVNTWTAALSYYGARTAQATLTVYAYCLKASFPIGVHIVQSPRPDFFPGDGSPLTSTVVCPQGAALTGGGFQTHYGNGGAVTSQPANYVFASKPDSNGWSVTTESQSSNYGQIVFAVCATQNLTASDPTMHNFVASPTSSVEDSATCPSSFQLLTGGGFEAGFNGSHGGFGTDLFYADHATSDLSKWDIQLYNADTGQHGIERSWAVCVGLPQHT